MNTFNIDYTKPWYQQWHYLVVLALLVFSPFLFLPGQKPLLCLVVIITALARQSNRRLSVIYVRKPPELILFTMWAIWAVSTGAIVAKNAVAFRSGVMQLARMTVMLWAFFALFYRQKNCSYIYISLIIVSILQVVASILGIELDSQELALVQSVSNEETARIAGITGNANSMGFVMLTGIWCCIMLWKSDIPNKSEGLRKLVLLLLIALFSYFVIQTASRKTFIVMAIMLAGWLVWMVPGRFSFKSVFIAGTMAIIAIIIGTMVFGYVMQDTYMGHRLLQWSDAGGGSLREGFKENIRYWMYVDGLKMFHDHPIAGVGLNQFAYYFFAGLYSHSDYMEPLACTGLVGFLLYQGFAISVTFRILRLMKQPLPARISYLLKGMLLFMIGNHYLIGIGCPHWNITEHNMVVIFIGIYALKVQKIGINKQQIYMS